MNIFVAKLNFRTSERSLRSLFEEFGDVNSVKIVMDRDTGRQCIAGSNAKAAAYPKRGCKNGRCGRNR